MFLIVYEELKDSIGLFALWALTIFEHRQSLHKWLLSNGFVYVGSGRYVYQFSGRQISQKTLDKRKIVW